jgi:hypothetical protein
MSPAILPARNRRGSNEYQGVYQTKGDESNGNLRELKRNRVKTERRKRASGDIYMSTCTREKEKEFVGRQILGKIFINSTHEKRPSGVSE